MNDTKSVMWCEKPLLRELKSLKREFLLYYNFFVKGCQVVKIPVCKGLCNLFEVVIGCQKVVKHPKGRSIRAFYAGKHP